MSRNVPSLGTLFAVSTFGMSALLLVACTGKVIGNGGPPLQAVNASEISQPVVPCGGGYAHPNVCCEASPGKASSCGVFPGAPFQACGSGYSTYPDPRSCCALDGSGTCIAPPPTPPSPVPLPGCSYACPPGQYEPAGSPGTCCFDDGATTVCSGGSGIGVGCGGTGCACPACVEGSPCPPCDCPPEPSCPPSPPACFCPACPVGETCPCDCGPTPTPVPVCNACPPGWQVPVGEPLLCCNESSSVIECFSQGVPPTPVPTPVPLPGGTGGGLGAHCGGNKLHPATCAPGYKCTPIAGSTLPFGDVGGTCQ
jgi:hypothetical protein